MTVSSSKQWSSFFKGLVQSPAQLYKLLILLCVVTMTIFIIKGNMCPPQKSPKIICIEDPESEKLTGLEDVSFLPFANVEPEDCLSKVTLRGTLLSADEISAQKQCVSNYESDYKAAHTLFWSDDNQYIRRSHHTYLNNTSLILDIGGNVGEDAEDLILRYNPRNYVMLEPLKILYRRLVTKFRNRPNVVIYNFGLSKKNEKFMLNIEGNEGDATSPFVAQSSEGTCSLKVVNTTIFLTKLGVGCYDVDLLTINCEGCEFDVLESILNSSLINNFKHIQFATHTKLAYLSQPVTRYCKIQELLKRTHKISYMHKFNWETWIRKDVSR